MNRRIAPASLVLLSVCTLLALFHEQDSVAKQSQGTQNAVAAAPAASASLLGAQAPAKLSGLWRTEGYGYLIQVVGDSLKAFEVTDLSCIPGSGRIRSSRMDRASFSSERTTH